MWSEYRVNQMLQDGHYHCLSCRLTHFKPPSSPEPHLLDGWSHGEEDYCQRRKMSGPLITSCWTMQPDSTYCFRLWYEDALSPMGGWSYCSPWMVPETDNDFSWISLGISNRWKILIHFIPWQICRCRKSQDTVCNDEIQISKRIFGAEKPSLS